MFEKELYKMAFGANPLPIVLTDFQGNILDASIGFAVLFEVQRDDLMGVNLKDVIKIEIVDDLDMEVSVNGEFYRVRTQKYDIEGFEFYIFSFDKIEQLLESPTSSILVHMRDLFEISIKVSTFPEFIASTFPVLQEIFDSSCVMLLKRQRSNMSRFYIVYGTCDTYKELRDEVQIIVESESILNVGMPIVSNRNGEQWGSLSDFLKISGFNSVWAVPFGVEEDFVDSIGILLFNDVKEPGTDEYNLLVFLSYYYSLVLQKTEFKKEFEALSYKDLVSQTYSEALTKELVALECEQAKRYDFNFSVMMIRIENYDKLSNIYGNYSIETSMQKIAKALQLNLRKSDIVGRLSKNSFLILLPFTNSSGVEVVYSRALGVLKDNVFPPCKNIKFSTAITSYIQGDEGVQGILDRLTGLLEPLI
ncbi:MAG TPA: diguanylate cyclase [Candidatus Hydrothermia bacterium]|nr:diguanylate cyclase [Candidatus Hydrothermia bacterium]HOP32330.1 diguanylate cyclase [Candidatus Hydrothermia bacterium]